MTDVHIGEMKVRYRFPARTERAAERMDKVLMTMLDQELERALEERGIPSDGDVLVRETSAIVTLRSGTTDQAAARLWAASIADSISADLHRGHGSAAVIYESRVEALLDLAAAAAYGRLERQWAWRRLGLWQDAAPSASRGEAGLQWVQALRNEPRYISPVVIESARLGLLGALLGLLDTRAWSVLAQAALENVTTGWLRIAESREPLLTAPTERRLSVPPASQVAQAVVATVDDEREASFWRAFAVFSLFEASPPLLCEPLTAAAAIEEVATALRTSASRKFESAPGAASSRQKHSGQLLPAASTLPEPLGVTESKSSRGADSDQSAGSPQADVPEQATPATQVRKRAYTAFGGLLFLLHLVDDLDLPNRILRDPQLEARPFRWTLYRIALELSPLSPDDPAALAFAGLPPEDPPPALLRPPATQSEARRIRFYARVLERKLRHVLRLESARRADSLAFVARRPAEIVVDPGWIEARFSLDDVAIEIRRVGLDIDLDFIPWLGVVVRFAYE